MADESNELKDALVSNWQLSVDLLEQSIDDMTQLLAKAQVNVEVQVFLRQEIKQLEQLRANLVQLRDGERRTNS